jgi:hypothetical protein
MRSRKRSVFSRAGDVVPVFGVAGLGIAVAFVVMNILVTWAPIAVDSPSPSVSALPSFVPSPSVAPSDTPTPVLTPPPTASLPPTRPTLIRSAISAADPNGVWTVYLVYPTFLSGTTPWADAINAQMTDEMQGRAAQWEVGPAAGRRPGVRKNTLSGSFTTELLTPALASFTITWADDSSAQPPGLSVETVTYDLASGQRLAFGDLFPDATVALNVLSLSSRALLQDQLGAGYDPAVAVDGTAPSAANFGNWAVTPTGVKFTFAQYQVTRRPDLQPAVLVPWNTLRPVMTQTGPLAAVAGF